MIVNSGYDLVNYHEIKSEWSYFLSFSLPGLYMARKNYERRKVHGYFSSYRRYLAFLTFPLKRIKFKK